MKTYTVYVHDRRYSVPTLLVVDLAHDERARAFARERLVSSTFHTGIEVWDGDTKLCQVGGEAPAWTAQPEVRARA